MTPYYDKDGITIYHGDCLTVLNELPETEIHALITDPPYASGARTEASKGTSGAMLRGARWESKPIENDQMTTTGFVWLLRHICRAARERLVDGGNVLIFIDWRQWPNLAGAVETTDLRLNQMVVWDKRSMGLGNGFRSQHELVLHASKGTTRVCDHSRGNVIACKRDGNEDHPSPKPVELMERLIEVTTNPGDLILDPFMGAGSTLIAAKNLGRRAIGIEAIEQHCETAVKRLAQISLNVWEPLPTVQYSHVEMDLS